MAKIVLEENCRLLTDRWGYIFAELETNAEIVAAVERLRPFMWDEVSFVAERRDEYGTQIGILLETEFDDDIPVESCIPNAEALSAEFPDVEIWLTQGDHVFFGRAALRAFIPAEQCTTELTERMGNKMLGFPYPNL